MRLPKNELGYMESRIFPALVLSVGDMLNHNLAEVLAILQSELNTEKHKNYCQQLSKS